MDQVMLGNYEHWSLKTDKDNILWLSLDRKNSSVNSLNDEVLKEFDQILNGLSQNAHVKAVVIRSLKTSGFIVGADISQFDQLENSEQATKLIQKGQAIFQKLEDLPMPTIALIRGFCLGGGLELALACKYRIVEDNNKTRLGLPEVKLGIHPGWGGTVRLPNLIGPIKAMDLILSGRAIKPKAAKKMGLVNECIPKRLINKVVVDYALKPPKANNKLDLANKFFELPFARSLLARLLNKKLSSKISKKFYPAPFKVVKNWVKYGTKGRKCYEKEAQSIGKLLVSDTSKNLVKIFFLQEKLKSQAKGVEFKPKHVHVIGAGVMGGDIAAWCALRGFKVTLQDQAPSLIGDAVKRTYDLAKKRLKDKSMVQATMDRLMPDQKGVGIKTADVIIEAITEKLSAKQGLFKVIESVARKDAILATNTSTIPLEEISEVLKDPGRLVGIHFFNPVAKMPLVEVVKGEKTHAEVTDKAIAFVKTISKLPLAVKSAPGFLVNRILLPYMLEAVALLDEGVQGPIIDKAAVDFGMPMGPIELADQVGLDICLAALEKLSSHLGVKVPEKLQEFVKKGELGKKVGKGFYNYKKGKVVKPKTSITDSAPKDIQDRLILRLLNEAVACLREGIVENPDFLDAGCIFGFGFPPFRGGPINYTHTQGEENLIKTLNELASRYGDRFTADEGWQRSA